MPNCPHCGATTADGHVPTDHSDYQKPDIEATLETPPPSSLSPLSLLGRSMPVETAPILPRITPKQYLPPFVTEFCPHRHIVVNGKPYCAECLGLGPMVGSFAEFMERLIDICTRVSRSGKFLDCVIPQPDRRNHAVLSVLLKIDVIAGARKPEAMAWRIAENSIKTLQRKKFWTETQIKLYAGDDQEFESEERAWDRLVVKNCEQTPERAIRFGRDDRRLMLNMLADAFWRIPPQQSFHLRARYGFYPECGKITVAELAALRNQTVDQIRYSLSQGLKNLLAEMIAMMDERTAFLTQGKRKA